MNNKHQYEGRSFFKSKAPFISNKEGNQRQFGRYRPMNTVNDVQASNAKVVTEDQDNKSRGVHQDKSTTYKSANWQELEYIPKQQQEIPKDQQSSANLNNHKDDKTQQSNKVQNNTQPVGQSVGQPVGQPSQPQQPPTQLPPTQPPQQPPQPHQLQPPSQPPLPNFDQAAPPQQQQLPLQQPLIIPLTHSIMPFEQPTFNGQSSMMYGYQQQPTQPQPYQMMPAMNPYLPPQQQNQQLSYFQLSSARHQPITQQPIIVQTVYMPNNIVMQPLMFMLTDDAIQKNTQYLKDLSASINNKL